MFHFMSEESKALASDVASDVFALTPSANSRKIFAAVELPALLENSSAATINGIPVGTLRDLWHSEGVPTPQGLAAALDAVGGAIDLSVTLEN